MNAKCKTWIAALFAAACGFAEARAPRASHDVVCRIESERGVLPANQTAKTVLKISLDAPPAPGGVFLL